MCMLGQFVVLFLLKDTGPVFEKKMHLQRNFQSRITYICALITAFSRLVF